MRRTPWDGRFLGRSFFRHQSFGGTHILTCPHTYIIYICVYIYNYIYIYVSEFWTCTANTTMSCWWNLMVFSFPRNAYRICLAVLRPLHVPLQAISWDLRGWRCDPIGWVIPIVMFTCTVCEENYGVGDLVSKNQRVLGWLSGDYGWLWDLRGTAGKAVIAKMDMVTCW